MNGLRQITLASFLLQPRAVVAVAEMAELKQWTPCFHGHKLRPVGDTACCNIADL